jgi:N-acetylneuraminate synthase
MRRTRLPGNAEAAPSTDSRCLVVAEVAQAHDGSLGTAHAFIDAIADAGADVVKFQTHIAAAESTLQEPWRVKFSRQDVLRYDYWKRMEFTEEQWQGLKEHATARGLMFVSSPFSVEAVDLLERVGVAAWKVASGEVAAGQMLDRMLATRLPVWLSSGMSTRAELDAVVACIQRAGVPFTVLQCTTAYPCPPERVGLNLLAEYRREYDCPVGLSDHSGTIFPSLAAVAHGASLVEVHVTFHRRMFGPDVPASVTVEELAQLVRGVRFIEAMLAHPVDKDAAAAELGAVRALFRKSAVARVDLEAGTLLRPGHLGFKKPGTGIPEAKAGTLLIGRRVKSFVARDTIIEETMVE